MTIDDCKIHRDSNGNLIKRHEYHPISGWCLWGCGCRNDGRVVSIKSGHVIRPGRVYTPAELDKYRLWIAEQEAA